MSRKRNAAPKELFLSHSSADVRFVRRLAKILADHGVKCFVSSASIRGGHEWHDQIGAALKRCDWFLVVVSRKSVQSRWVRHELIAALQKQRYRERIIPLRYQTCDAEKLSWALSNFQEIDFRKNVHQACSELLNLWGIAYTGTYKSGA
jgi:hypothetical protein